MKLKSTRALTLTELMVAGLLSVVVLGATMHVISKLFAKEQEAELAAKLSVKASQLSVILAQEIDKAVYLRGKTNEGSHFEGSPTFGIMRHPFEPVGSSVSDGVEIFGMDSSYSTDTVFKVTGITMLGSDYQISVQGDFRPLKAVSSDYLLMKVGPLSELFTVKSAIAHSGGLPGTSTFTVEESAEDFIDYLSNPHIAGHPELLRVSRKIFQVGNDSGVTTGLFMKQGDTWTLIEKDVTSMQVRYELQARSEPAESDCEAKSDSRFFPLAVADSDCSWNDVSNIRWEYVIESEAKLSQNSEHPHTGTVSNTAKVLHILSKAPALYITELLN